MLAPATLSELLASAAACDDAGGTLPRERFGLLAGAGLLSGAPRLPEQMRVLSEVAAVHGSLARVLDGHFNAVERLGLAASLSECEQQQCTTGELLLGVWGADPVAGEGEPLRLHDGVLEGVKTFCSGAGVVDRALVVARDAEGVRRLAYVDVSSVEVDRSWYAGAGLRASESHRVVFAGEPALEILGDGDELLREPYFSRDALRTSSTWVGLARGLAREVLALLAVRGPLGDTDALAAGQIDAAVEGAQLWLAHAAQAPGPTMSIRARWAIARHCREVIAHADEACGSRPLSTHTALSRQRRDLDLFLLQHRLAPSLARHGHALVRGL
ncbi:MAG: hypothetical protein NVS1B9_04230 [Solirubrobacteraceae bacterium]